MASFSLAILNLRDFRSLLFTRTLLIMALQSQAVIVGWQVYSLTKSPFLLGLVGLAEAIPALTCALVAGHIVDISRPHRVYMVCLGVLIINTFLLLLVAGGYVATPFGDVVPWIFAGVFISGIARSFVMPSSFSLLPQVVPREKIPAASACMGGGFQIAAIGGPAVAGLVYGGYGASVAWFMPVGLMALALLMLSGMGKVPRQYRSGEKREPAVKSIKAGWSFIIHNRVLLSVMALDMFAVLFGGAVAMLPAFADQVLQLDAEGLGMLRAAPAVGAVTTAIYLAGHPLKNIRATLLFAVVAGFGVSMIGFGLSHTFWMALFFLALSGAFDSCSMVIRGSLMQLLTPDNMRGRVSAVNSMFIISSNEIGAFESGVAADLLGLVPSIILGGVGTLIVVGVIAGASPRLRKLVVNAADTKM